MAMPTTRWTLLARLEIPEQRESALEVLCRQYWTPVFAYLRRRGCGHEEAEDLAQSFFERILREELFERVDPAMGEFRSLLLAWLENFAANAMRTRSALKRGGGWVAVPLDGATPQDYLEKLAANCATPAEAFDRAWLAALLQRVVAQLELQYAEAGKEALFSALLPWLMDRETAAQSSAAAQAGISVAHFRVQLHRLRIRYRDALEQEVIMTVGERGDAAAEMKYLQAISRGWM